jgi:hypothetical protein
MATKAEIPPPTLADDPDWDRVDQAAWESFPASDPPGFSSARAAASRAAVDETAELCVRNLQSHLRRERIRSALGIGARALGVVVLWKLARKIR